MEAGRYFWTRIPHWILFAIIPKFGAFLRRPWSVGETFWLAALAGAVSPVSTWLCFNFLPWEKPWLPWRGVPLIFPAFVAALVALLYWRVRPGNFRTDRRAMLATALAGLLWTAGITGSAWCLQHHVCMGGHMQHPPYPGWHYAIDTGWTLALLVAAIWTRLVRTSLCILFVALATSLISYRFLFGSFGVLYEWLPL